MSRQPAMLALTVPSTTRQSHDLISPEKTMPRPTTSLRIAVCAASAALAADWFGVIGAMAPRGLNVLVIMPVPSSGRYGKEWATLLLSRAPVRGKFGLPPSSRPNRPRRPAPATRWRRLAGSRSALEWAIELRAIWKAAVARTDPARSFVTAP